MIRCLSIFKKIHYRPRFLVLYKRAILTYYTNDILRRKDIHENKTSALFIHCIFSTHYQIRGERYDQHDTAIRTKQARHCT